MKIYNLNDWKVFVKIENKKYDILCDGEKLCIIQHCYNGQECISTITVNEKNILIIEKFCYVIKYHFDEKCLSIII